MLLRCLRDGAWKVLAVDDGKSDNLEVFLENCNRTKDVSQLEAFFDAIADGELDPRQLPDSKCHHIAEKIWQFTQGKIRVLWFYDKGSIIVACLGFQKMTKKTPNRAMRRAIKLRELYFKDKNDDLPKVKGTRHE